MKKVLAILLAVALIATFAACAKPAEEAAPAAPEAEAPAAEEAAPAEDAAEEAPAEEAPAEEAAPAEGPYEIGVSVPSLEFTFFAAMKAACDAAYPTDEVVVTVYDGENNQEKQNKDVEDMITKGVDGIVLIPNTVEGAVPAIKYANEMNVPVLTVDREVTPEAGVDVIGFVGSDHVPMGISAAEQLIAGLKEKFPDVETYNVVEIEGTQGASATILRGQGIHEVLEKDPSINIIGSFDGDFSTTEATSIAEDMLTAHPDLHGFICHNDMEAEGCYQALVNANRKGEIVIVGIDGQLSTVQKVVTGDIYATVIQYPAMVTMGVDVMVDYLNGKEIEKVSYYPTDPVPPTAAQEMIDNGNAW